MMRRVKDEGAVLITTLFIMAIIATISVGYFALTMQFIDQGRDIRDQGQMQWYVKGAEDFANIALKQQAPALSQPGASQALMAAEPVILPFENGLITLRFSDASNCISIPEIANGSEALLLTGWAEAVGMGAPMAELLRARLTDWQDADDQLSPGGMEDFGYLGRDPAMRTASSPVNSLAELNIITDAAQIDLQGLEPAFCPFAMGADHRLNINAMTEKDAPLLASMLGKEAGLPLALQLLTERPPLGFADQETLLQSPALSTLESSKIPLLDRIGYRPEYIGVTLEISFGDSRRVIYAVYKMGDNGLERLYRSQTAPPENRHEEETVNE